MLPSSSANWPGSFCASKSAGIPAASESRCKKPSGISTAILAAAGWAGSVWRAGRWNGVAGRSKGVAAARGSGGKGAMASDAFCGRRGAGRSGVNGCGGVGSGVLVPADQSTTSSAGLDAAEVGCGLIRSGFGTSVAQSRKSGLTGAGRSRAALSCSRSIGGATSGTSSQSS